MRRSLASLALALSTAMATSTTPVEAQSLYVGTYSGSGCCSGLTRGYSFVAPMDFVITQLAIHGATGPSMDATLQVLRFNSAIPTWSSTSNDFSSLLYLAGQTSASVNVAVSAGDIIAILGYANGFSPYNSEGSPLLSSIGGSDVTLFRTGFQGVGQAHDVWIENGSIGMIDMQYSLTAASTVPEPTTVVLLGTGLVAVAAAARRRRRSASA